MSTQEQIYKPTTSSFVMLRAMVGIGLMCALGIVLTYEGTLPRVKRLKAEALERAIFRVIPGATQTVPFALSEQEGIFAVDADSDIAPDMFAGFNDAGELTGIAIEASGQGYADIIRILYGYDPTQEAVVGMYVLETKETPGLGDKIEKDPAFLENFKALDVSLNTAKDAVANTVVTVKAGTKQNPWEVDGITGATISSRAIGNIIGTSSQEIIPLIYKNMASFKVQAEQNNEQ